MAVTQTMCTAAKLAYMRAGIDYDNDELKIALYTSAASLDATTAAYTAVGEVVGTGYTAGGQTLTGVATTASGTTAYATFDAPIWPGAAITANAALIYDVTRANLAIAVISFGANKTSTTSFDLQMPAATADTALLRIA